MAAVFRMACVFAVVACAYISLRALLILAGIDEGTLPWELVWLGVAAGLLLLLLRLERRS